jgi:hypothetical protein
VIVVSIVVDGQRMHITKNDWDVFVDDFASQTAKKVKEQLDQFVDIPYFADSEHVLVVQAADRIA